MSCQVAVVGEVLTHLDRGGALNEAINRQAVPTVNIKPGKRRKVKFTARRKEIIKVRS